jgi:hypothetical protein
MGSDEFLEALKPYADAEPWPLDGVDEEGRIVYGSPATGWMCLPMDFYRSQQMGHES